ncbi:RMD1 [Candida theae]|uniref:RMD1 n=1 Tax=Candida theae TaxID=1198502 RepID=A0AAD5FX46_9ASCO|nr:RMD1 [Candida theae]KAI5950064.1 RMD1 [Candida theae]
MSQQDGDDTTPLLSTHNDAPENPLILATTASSNSLNPTTDSVASRKKQGAANPNPNVVPLKPHSSKVAKSNKIGLQRTSRTSQKLKLLPEDPDLDSMIKGQVTSGGVGDDDDDDDDDAEGDDNFATRPTRVYSQVKRITNTFARKDAETLGKSHRDMLPRVTAYCTCASYRMKDLLRWLKDRKRIHNTSPKLFDECLYTPFTYKDWRNDSNSNNNDADDGNGHKLIRLADEGGEINIGKRSDLFVFEYGVVIMWGFTQKEEAAFLDDLAKFESEKLSAEDIQVEEFNYYITKSYQPRIYNDFITLKDDENYMLKLSISHALAQSVKISLFEELVDNTIEDTQDIPQQIAHTGKVEMSRDEIMKSIGELFILRININLHGSVLDSPELMWAEPHLEPIYQATRGYLEINQRVELLNQRLEVISDLLQLLKEQLGHSHEENLEFIVVVLVGVEVLVSIINIIIDVLTYKR